MSGFDDLFFQSSMNLGENLFCAIRWRQRSEPTYFGLDVYK